LQTQYEKALDSASISRELRPHFRKWLRFYLDFCSKYGHSPRSKSSVPLFMAKLASKNQPEAKRNEASVAVTLYFKMADTAKANALSKSKSESDRVCSKGAQPGGESSVTAMRECAGDHAAWGNRRLTNSSDRFTADLSLREAGGSMPPSRERIPVAAPIEGRGSSWLTHYEEMKGVVRMRNYSDKTLGAYRYWIGKFQAFVRSKPPDHLNTEDVKGFLTDLAVRQNVAGATQNQAFNALLFFYRHVLRREFGKIDGVVRAKRRPYVPVVLSRAEVEAVLERLLAPYRLVGALLYGCGLRLSECLELRIHCFNFDSGLLTVHDGKGQKDRTVPLPARMMPEIREQIEAVRRVHKEDLAVGYSGVFLPRQLDKKYRSAAREFIWQWFFPAATLTSVPGSGEKRRYHLHDSHVQSAVKKAASEAGISKGVSPHTFRHTFASHLLLANYDIQTIQKLLGPGDVRTTMIYLQTVPSLTLKEARSPMDLAG
jgi:integron integrase